ncbi:MAG: mechanosensitive ion channel family protein [Anaerolineales bacterium]
MDILNTTLFDNTFQQWLIALGLTIIAVLALRLLQALVRKRLENLASRTQTTLDDMAADLANRTRFLFLVIVAIYIGSLSLSLPEQWQRILGTVVIISLWIQAGFWGAGLVRHFISSKLRQEKAEDDAAAVTTVSALGATASVILWALVLLMALDNIPGVEVTALLASLGVGGIAVALALQNILGDLFASLAIALDKPFVIGDFIIIGEYVGTVERIGLKTTRIRSLSGEQIIFSNSDLLNSRVRNYKVMYERRVVFEFGLLYETPIDLVEQVGGMIKDIISGIEKARFDRAHFETFGDSALKFEVVYYVLDPDYNLYMDIQERINLELMRRFDEEGIKFAYPAQRVYLGQTEV